MAHRGSFQAAAYTPDGSAVLLFDQGDGVRLLKTDASLGTVLGETHLGAAGDAGVALATDASGTVCIAGTSSSGLVRGTPGAAFPTAVDASLNSFVACFGSDLSVRFLTFLGAPRTAVSSLAVTGDAVFATGVTYSEAFPATAAALQARAPLVADGSGFVERFSLDGARLVYGTYLGGGSGATSPAAITADKADNVYVAGSTSAADFPTVAALQPVMMASYAGFLTSLSPPGDRIRFSTFLAGSGATSVTLNQDQTTLLLTGTLDPGQFPVADTLSPVVDAEWQGLLRLSTDGQMLQDSVLLFPGDRSSVSAAPGGGVWVTGALAVPLLEEEAHAGPGEAVALHLDAADRLDAVIRLGGAAANHLAHAALNTSVGAAAPDAAGAAVLLPGTVRVQTDSLLAPSQALSLGLLGGTSLLPSSARDLVPLDCTGQLPCEASGGLLALLAVPDGTARLELSQGDLPLLTVRNATATPATSVAIGSSTYPFVSGCPQLLVPGAQCGVLLSGMGDGAVNLAAQNAPAASFSLSVAPRDVAPGLSFSEMELDFGVVTGGQPATRTLEVRNLRSTDQTFASLPDVPVSSAHYTLTEVATTCAGPPTAHIVPANGTCVLCLQVQASSASADDGIVTAGWQVGEREIPVTAFAQAGALSLSAARVDFGPQPTSSTGRLPRFLYLSNFSATPQTHTPMRLPADAPFGVGDECPSLLAPGSVCQIEVTYLQKVGPAFDSMTLSLDQGLQVTLTGAVTAGNELLPAATASSLQLSASWLTFASAVVTGDVSTEQQTLQITNNSGDTAAPAVRVLGDFRLAGGCASPVPPGGSCSVAVQFAPTATGEREGLLSVSVSAAESPVMVSLSGTGTPLLLPETGILDLRETAVGEPVVRWFQVQSLAQHFAVHASGPGFGVALREDQGNGHGSLPSGAFAATASQSCFRCWLGVQFLPGSAGAAAGALEVSAGAGNGPVRLPLQGWGMPVAGLLLTPAQAAFGSVPAGSTSVRQMFTVTNASAGPEPVTLQGITASGDFEVTAGNNATRCGATLAAGASCSLAVIFSPTMQGIRSGTLGISSASGSTFADLTGTGTPDPGLSLRPNALTFTSPGTQAVQVTNTGKQTVTVALPLISDDVYTVTSGCAALAPGQSCALQVASSPSGRVASPSSFLTLPVSFDDLSGQNSLTAYAVALSTAFASSDGSLSVFPALVDFGAAAVNVPGAIRQLTLVNNGPRTYSLQLSGTQHFPLADPTGCVTLLPGATCTFSLMFLPQAAGSLNGTVQIAGFDDSGGTTSVALAVQGYGVSPATLALSGGPSGGLPLSFGTLLSGEAAFQSLTLTNQGADPVHLRHVVATTPFHADADCGVELLPGNSCTVSLSYAPVLQLPASSLQAPRTDTGTLTLQSDTQNSPDTINLAGLVQPVTTASPAVETSPTLTLSATAATFAATPGGAVSAVQDLVLRNTGSVPARVEAMVATEDFKVQSDCSALQPGDACPLHLAFAPRAANPARIRTGALRLKSDAAVSMDFVTLLGSVAEAPLQLSASSLLFMPVAIGGGTSSAQLTLANTTALPLYVEAFQLDGPYSFGPGTCPIAGGTLPAGGTCTLAIVFAPVSPGTAAGTLTLRSPGLPASVSVSLSGKGLAGRLQVSPETLDFGSLPVSSSATRTVHLLNAGDADLVGLHMTLAQGTAGAFQLGPPCTANLLAAGGTCEVTVTFSPQAPGSQAATLSMASSDPGSPARVALTGSGMAVGVPGFSLTVNGTDQATVTLSSGSSMSFPLLLTPQRGFRGPVSLQCRSMQPAPSGNCSLSAAQMSLEAGPASGSVAIGTESGLGGAMLLPWGCLFLTPWAYSRRRKRTRDVLLAVFAAGIVLTSLGGCADGAAGQRVPYTPPGTYVYGVTATSAVDASIASTVTLTVTVR